MSASADRGVFHHKLEGVFFTLNFLYNIPMKKLIPIFLSFLILSLSSCSKKVSDNKGPKIYDNYGQEFLFKKQKGKYIIVNYWASWCPPCMKEIPELAEFQSDHKDEVAVLGVNLEPYSSKALNKLIFKLGINYPVTRSDPSLKLNIDSPSMYPTTVIIDKQGNIAKIYQGPVTEMMLEEFISG